MVIIYAFGNEPEEFSMDEWRLKNESLEVKDKRLKIYVIRNF